VAYVIERESRSGTRYVGIYRAADGTYKSAGTYDSHERAVRDTASPVWTPGSPPGCGMGSVRRTLAS
jgi:hypothetical protein